MSTGKRKAPQVVTFVPTDGPRPASLAGGKRTREAGASEAPMFSRKERDAFMSGDARTVHSAVPASTGPRGPRRPALRDDQAIRVDFRDIWKTVTTFAASSYTGKDKKVYEAEQIRALGGRVEWKEKMPHKMWLGVTKARKARAERLAAEAKAAGLVTGRPGSAAGAALSKPKERRWRKGGVDDGVTPDNIRGPVMHVRPQN